ncbi:uncharacterized protein N7498_003086 [Penicillium cinerascens]|uniref:Uncharacterized protein n=1 Tax=Penicillium cinerascens TaxID=70096 RepID=A0A9W9N1L7_9EURO|nr:uncharacterized protein N7498_003086 [Penicillium cinerascens]KAJ5211440.1 hypothetical protein N7498_003086 [Penicillium cinerascens]
MALGQVVQAIRASFCVRGVVGQVPGSVRAACGDHVKPRNSPPEVEGPDEDEDEDEEDEEDEEEQGQIKWSLNGRGSIGYTA